MTGLPVVLDHLLGHGQADCLPGDDIVAEVNAAPDARVASFHHAGVDDIGIGGELVGQHLANGTRNIIMPQGIAGMGRRKEDGHLWVELIRANRPVGVLGIPTSDDRIIAPGD